MAALPVDRHRLYPGGTLSSVRCAIGDYWPGFAWTAAQGRAYPVSVRRRLPSRSGAYRPDCGQLGDFANADVESRAAVLALCAVLRDRDGFRVQQRTAGKAALPYCCDTSPHDLFAAGVSDSACWYLSLFA